MEKPAGMPPDRAIPALWGVGQARPEAMGGLGPLRCPVRLSVAQAMPPVIGMTAVVLDHEDSQLIDASAIINAEGESPHRVTSQVAFDHGPEAWRRLDLDDRGIELSQGAVAEPRGPRLVELGGLDHLRPGLRMAGQSHPIARRAACMTSS